MIYIERISAYTKSKFLGILEKIRGSLHSQFSQLHESVLDGFSSHLYLDNTYQGNLES